MVLPPNLDLLQTCSVYWRWLLLHTCSTNSGPRGEKKLSNKPRSPRRIRVRAIPRREPDIRKLGKALLELAMLQARAEAEAQAEREEQEKKEPPRAA